MRRIQRYTLRFLLKAISKSPTRDSLYVPAFGRTAKAAKRSSSRVEAQANRLANN